MRNSLYSHGRTDALIKLGLWPRLLTTTGLGALGGYMLAPEDRKGMGAVLGGAGGLLGGVTGPALGKTLAGNAPNTAMQHAAPVAGTALGTLGGLGLSHAYINKDTPDTSEDPYHYYRK